MQHLHDVTDLKDLRRLAVEIASQLAAYPIVLLKGDLGTGKTTLAQMICKELGIEEPVTSPTYTLVNEYSGPTRKSVYHFDLYRLKNENELEGFGFAEYLDSGNICLIEWPEIAENFFAGLPVMEVCLHKNENTRQATIELYTQTA